MGGGMRQAGILAAAGLHALDHHVSRLAMDHKHAVMLETALNLHPDVHSVDPVETNIVIATLAEGRTAAELVADQQERGVLCSAFGPDKVRWVTHLDANDADVAQVVQAIEAWR